MERYSVHNHPQRAMFDDYDKEDTYNHNSMPSDIDDFECNQSIHSGSEPNYSLKEESTCALTSEDIKAIVNKQVRVGIFDMGTSGGKIEGKEKCNTLLRALFEMMYSELLSDADIRPRFSWSGIVDGVYRAVAVGESSAAFLKDRVEEMPPPWPGAKLEVIYRAPKVNFVEAFVPGEPLRKRSLYQVIRKFDPRFPLARWRQIKVRPHNDGHVFTFTIDDESYELLDKYDGYIPYLNSRIEFRVLKPENL